MQSYAARKPRFRASLQGNQGQTLTTTSLAGTETSLYYFGARYLDPKTSRWISVDPAMYDGSYIPSAPINDEARKRNGNLPGMGGIYNAVNMHVYHYAGNNPIKLVDPDGEKVYVAYNRIFGYRTHGVKMPGQKLFYHATIVITDDDNNVTHYIEAGPVGGKTTKITDGSYSDDRFLSKGLTPSAQDGEWQKQFDGPVVQIDPSSMDLSEFETNILVAAENYQNQSDYESSPSKKKGTSNSNSFAFSILRKALVLDRLVLTTPEKAEKMSEDREKTKPTVSKWRVRGWDVNIE